MPDGLLCFERNYLTFHNFIKVLKCIYVIVPNNVFLRNRFELGHMKRHIKVYFGTHTNLMIQKPIYMSIPVHVFITLCSPSSVAAHFLFFQLSGVVEIQGVLYVLRILYWFGFLDY